MANKERGEVTLDLGGETYVLVPSFGAVCEIEGALGSNLFKLSQRLAIADIAAREVIDFTHACLIHACPSRANVKHDKAALGEAIFEAGPLEVMTVLAEFCFNYALGGQREKKAPDAEPAAPSPLFFAKVASRKVAGGFIRARPRRRSSARAESGRPAGALCRSLRASVRNAADRFGPTVWPTLAPAMPTRSRATCYSSPIMPGMRRGASQT